MLVSADSKQLSWSPDCHSQHTLYVSPSVSIFSRHLPKYEGVDFFLVLKFAKH